MSQLIDTWSSRADEEDSMTDEHAWIWREMIRAIPWPETPRVLDIGCNQGGFLRLLDDSISLASGVGIDLAKDAISKAEARKAGRPLEYLASKELTDAGHEFDIAVSHEVIYLISDLIVFITVGIQSVGLVVSASMVLSNAFVPLAPPNAYFASNENRLNVYKNWKLLFRCKWPN